MVQIFGHYVSKSFAMLGIIETLLLQAMLVAGVWLRFSEFNPAGEVPIGPLWPKAIVYSAVVILCMVSMGLYHRDVQAGFVGILLRIILALGLAFLVISALFYAYPPLFIGRGVLAYTLGASLLALTISRLLFFHYGSRYAPQRRILVLGTGKNAQKITDLRNGNPHCGFTIVGFVHVRGEHDEVPQNRIIATDNSLLGTVKTEQIEEIVVTVRNRRDGLPIEDLLEAKLCGVRVTDFLSFFERETGRIDLGSLYPSWLIYANGFEQHFLQQRAKRAFDIGVSLTLLILASPLMVGAVLAIWLESGLRGPIIYRQIRVGKDWNLIQVMKFRSMQVDAEKEGVAQWAQKNDARVTRTGNIIRKFRIDELPQLFNVLRGEMSFVGPRPERPEFVEQLAKTIPFYNERLRVKPGITGWAQVRYQYAATEQDSYNKLEYDLYYVKNFGIFLDFLILLYTAEVVLWRKGAV